MPSDPKTQAMLSTSLLLRKARVEVVSGPDTGVAVEISAGRFTAGSALGNDLVLHDSTVSRHHFEVVLDEHGYLLRDLDSTNGTEVQGLRCREVYLPGQARVVAGCSHLKFQSLSEEAEVELLPEDHFGELLGRSPAMRRVFAVLARVVPRNVTVLVSGESGTGKELVARALHHQGPRRDAQFVVVDCGAIPSGLMESEVFGQERGAFTGAVQARAGAFERADGGTLFLDEIGELPIELQPKLLRVLESREVQRLGGSAPRKVDVRVVAASNRDLRAEVNRGAFRGDLFYRLSVVEVRLPPLRDRPEDVPFLVRRFLDEIAARDGGDVVYELGPRTLERLAAHRWPGNVRELRNFVERSVSLADGKHLEAGSTLLGLAPLGEPVSFGGAAATAAASGVGGVMMAVDGHTSASGAVTGPAASPGGMAGTVGTAETASRAVGTAGTWGVGGAGEQLRMELHLPFKEAKRQWLEPFEHAYLAALLTRTSGNVSKAARDADLDRAYLIQLLKKYDLR